MLRKIDAGSPVLLKNSSMSTDHGFPAPPPTQVPGHQQPPIYYPAPPVSRVPAEPLAYHRLGRSAQSYRWYKPLLVGLIAIGLYAGMIIVVALVAGIAALLNPGFAGQLAASERALDALDMTDPLVLVIALGSIIAMLPAILLATLMLGAKPLGLLSSVAGRLRWGWLGCCLLLAAGVMVLSFALSFTIETVQGVPFAPDFGSEKMWLMIGLTLALVPLQATAEEYVFRGYLMQSLGGWLRHPAFAIALPIPLFVTAHGYDVYGQLDVGLFALAAGWLTWRTGGLEAAIGLHIVNNVVIFLLGSVALADVNATEGNLASLIASVFTMGAYVWMVVRFAQRRKIARWREPAPVTPEQGLWQQPPVNG